ncbi:MAG: hypothetical protein JKY88_02830 [Pseudomonadales bacterium]|nr:hypothetical protein [Pseudomonadales bacterium]
MSIKMSIKERHSFLAGLHVGIISIPREKRAPLTVPIWYDYEPFGKVWMLTQPDSLKGKALLNCEYISLCAQTEKPPYQYVTVEGKFEISDSNSEAGLKMAIRYLGETMGRQYADNSEDDGIILSFEPENWLTVDYSKM